MESSWLIWPIGLVVLIAAGFVAALLPRLRHRETMRRTAWSTARSAIDSASVSRDAATVAVPEADQLLHKAELLVAGGGGTAAATEAASSAGRADRLWREAGHD
ncbi:DUF6403 family protein [Actinoalloteichus hymeniacidonis]|uniref:Uncharacterized protein n=1 Tax=Actinoalloteichus hymeniacidonis TaxID=340345 RepID=A0AAC9HRC7_9PSEU|nr:DUF6403 family protein [Actinoalloteichus hymeniacidonis]AOS64030.1 hypothetical protein TL08_16150 [Actinoalloteichus hymeniacidonis]MBB5907908.1 hypothetical protein [Actinoalloteichus hymeniacidonis]